jgi:hypothetical protein
MSDRTIRSAPSSAAVLGAGAAFGVSIIGGEVGNWIESYWNMTVVGWEMAGLVVCVLVTVCGFFIGSAAGMIRRVVIATVLGAVVGGACLAAVSLTNGSPRGVTIWSISVGVCGGAAAGAVGGLIGKRERMKVTRSEEANDP